MKLKITWDKFAYGVLALYLLGIVLLLSGCATTPTTDTGEVVGDTSIRLTWEKGKTYSVLPETSDYLIALVKKDLALYDAAKDMKEICPKYASLPEAGRLKAIGEFYAGLALYESSWNVRSQSVDVGSASKKDTWSVGLFQVSAVDQSWAGGGTKYTYEELLTGRPNIHLATILMRRQLKNTGELLLPNASKYRYWAIILEGNKYQKISSVIARVKANAPGCM